MSSITTPNLLPDAVAADKRRYFMKSIAAPDGDFGVAALPRPAGEMRRTGSAPLTG
jgi:hypothetical protein